MRIFLNNYMPNTVFYCRVTKFGESTIKKVHAVLTTEAFTVKKHIELIELNNADGQAFLFPTGIIVDWTQNASLTEQLVAVAENIVNTPLKETLVEEYQYQWSKTQFRIADDTIFVPRKSTKIMLAISYALSQSTQLDYKEQKIASAFSSVEKISHVLMSTGKIGMGSKEIRRMIGSILYLQHDVSMYGMVNDKPELFWEHPELATYYNQTAAYLELNNRFEVINQKVAAIQSTLDVLRDEANIKHSNILEWVVILLIAFEIFYFIFESVVK